MRRQLARARAGSRACRLVLARARAGLRLCVAFRQRRARSAMHGIICKSGGYIIAPKSHLTAKKRHLSLSHCTSSTSNHTHTLLFAFCRGARVYIFTQPRAAKQTGHTSYTHTGARGGGLQDYIHTQVPEVPCVCVWRPSSRNAMN